MPSSASRQAILTEVRLGRGYLKDRLEPGKDTPSWWNTDLQGVNLKGADLRGAHLSHADLHHADMRGADLREAVLREMRSREKEEMGAWLDRWFSDSTRERIRQIVAGMGKGR